MKILFQSRIDLFTRRGGDTVQMEKTAKELCKLGIEVEIDCSANPDLSGYDLVHLFNIDWPAQVYLQAKNAKRQGKPIVFSPIHHSYREIERYEKESRFGLRRVVNLVFKSREGREKFKDFCRILADPKKAPSVLTGFRKGILNEQRELLEMADLVLVQTDAEVEDVEFDFGCRDAFVKRLPLDSAVPAADSPEPDSRLRQETGSFLKIVNGADPRFAEAEPDWFVEKYDLRDFVLCVGRIEPRKNQLAVIEAVGGLRKPGSGSSPELVSFSGSEGKESDSLRRKESDSGEFGLFSSASSFPCRAAKLLFVGRISWRHPEYALRFEHLVRKHDWIYHIPQIPYEKMGSCYAAAKVHVLASWFETTGLTSLEAGLVGANVVAAGKQAREYLGDFAEYCDPGDAGSIAAAIQRAWEKPLDPAFKQHILENFTWMEVARQTLSCYWEVLGK